MSPGTPGSRSRPAAVRRLPALDGIRGVLVIFLLAFHFGVGRLQGAWLTLNVFFVLSGFLIVRMLVEERAQTGSVRIGAFYARRARRLFPALATLLAVIVVYGLVFASSAVRASLKWDLFATMGYFMNWRLIAQSNQYFVQFAEPSMLQHTWSLSVEEQFYLVIPALLLLLMRVVTTRRALIAAFTGLAIVSAGWMAVVGVATAQARSHVYYGTDTRAQSLLLGAALGVLTARFGAGERRNPLPVKTVQLAGAAAFVVTLAGFLLAAPQTQLMVDGGMFVLSLAAVVWVWTAADARGGPLQRALAIPPLAALGRISYGAYLWHWPIGLWLGQLMPGGPVWLRVVLGFALTLGVATISYQRIERPIHDRGWRAVVGSVPRARTLAAGVLAALLFGAVGVGRGAMAAGQPQPGNSARIVSLVPGQGQFVPPAKPYTVALYGDSVPDLLVQNFPQQDFPGVHAVALAVPGCDLLDQPYVNQAGGGTVSPNHADCTQFKADTAQRLTAAHSQLLVIFPSILLGFPHRFGDRDLWWGDPRYSAAITARLNTIVAAARAAGSEPAIVTQTCRDSASGGLGRFVDVAQAKDPAMLREFRTADHVNSLIRSWGSQHGVPVADLDAALCPGGVPRQLPGLPVYGDDIHLSRQITPSVWAFLLAQLADRRAGQ
ncbi:acyltransferase family protein [Flexivirga caeni]|uniref:Uncharacterized protein n=1 Tax=Flexivirga caeni TaxID=2294115 RepID=A0A3M9LXH9_9MICO|nr:acyltransferase family protein [Flexivirga caeni]RNI17293.1 hypothetical protein EFY87_19425 [Flexivirga caeni]